MSKIPEIKFRLKYYPNNSLYSLGNEYRYVEYQFVEDKRIHHISSVEKTVYLKKILSLSENGAYITDLYPYLINEYIQQDDVINYIDDLVQSQILISELDPTITGEDFLTRILSVLDTLHINDSVVSKLKSIQNIMFQIDTSNDYSLNKYLDIEELVKNIGVPYNNKYLLQVDMNRQFSKATIGLDIQKEVISALTFLNKITSFTKNDNLSKFQEAFTNRYEEKEVALSLALDPETGLGYPIGNSNKETSVLLDDFQLPVSNNLEQNIRHTKIQTVLLEKLANLPKSQQEIELTDDDFSDSNGNWNDLPATLSVFFEIIRDQQNDALIRMKSIGGSSAANLLGRFAYTDRFINQLVIEITEKEQVSNPNVIYAEIAHLPDSRVGNILYRPHLRDYEIVYLANSSQPKDKLIFVSDLMLSVRNNRLILRSKRLNKEIIPRLTNAHNYLLSAIPIYRFLCDMQTQNRRSTLYFDWGFLYNELTYLPRVRYKHTILSPATWNLKTEEIKHLFTIEDETLLLQKAKMLCERKHIPQYSLLSDGDNDLYINWESALSLRAFFSIVKNRKTFRLTEFFYDEKNAVVKDDKGYGYLNECIVVLYKNEN